jgi:hypothetical protein
MDSNAVEEAQTEYSKIVRPEFHEFIQGKLISKGTVKLGMFFGATIEGIPKITLEDMLNNFSGDWTFKGRKPDHVVFEDSSEFVYRGGKNTYKPMGAQEIEILTGDARFCSREAWFDEI